MRYSLDLHLRSAHGKPQQPNRFDSPTDPGRKISHRFILLKVANFIMNDKMISYEWFLCHKSPGNAKKSFRSYYGKVNQTISKEGKNSFVD